MMKMQFHPLRWQSAVVSCTMSLLMVQFCPWEIGVRSASANPIMAQMSSVEFTPPPPPPDRDAPGHRGGGAGRSCGTGTQTITALVPQYQQTLPSGATITKVWGTTLAERPTLWFDIPHEKSATSALEFVLQDNSGNDVYRAAIAPPNTPGIISIRLPETAPALETGQLYQWFLIARIQCNINQPATRSQLTKEQLTGWIQRISPDTLLKAQLKQASPEQKMMLYAKNGIWFDTLTTLAELRLANSQDARLTQNWNTLLKTVELDKSTMKPLISR